MPPAENLHIAVEEAGATSYLRLEGEFDVASVAFVENELDRIFRAPTPQRVVFDLRSLTFLDAAGLRAILKADEEARAAHLQLVVVRPRGTANRVFTLTRAGEELHVVDEPECAA
jgi:anti-sigma B factor antagonist